MDQEQKTVHYRPNRANQIKFVLLNAFAKLAVSDIPFTFNGLESESIHRFRARLTTYCSNNNIDDESLAKLLLNGKVLKGAAFKFVENHLYHLDADLETSEKLEMIWRKLIEKYGQINQVIKQKKKLRDIKQENKSLKNYLDEFEEAVQELNMEIDIQNQNGSTYQKMNTYEIAEQCIKGLNEKIQVMITRLAIAKYSTPVIDMQQLRNISKVIIQEHQYLVHLQEKQAGKNKEKELAQLKEEIYKLQEK